MVSQTKFDEIHSKLEDFKTKLGIDQTQNTEFNVIVQNCCFETWALGIDDIPAQYLAKGTNHLSSLKYLLDIWERM